MSGEEIASQIKAKGDVVRDKKSRKENIGEDIRELKALKAKYLEATGDDWDVKFGGKKPTKSAKKAATEARTERAEQLGGAAAEPEPAAEGEGGETAEDGVRRTQPARSALAQAAR